MRLLEDKMLNLPDNMGACMYSKFQLCHFYGFRWYNSLQKTLEILAKDEAEIALVQSLKNKRTLKNREMNTLINILGKPTEHIPPRLSKKLLSFCYTFTFHDLASMVKNSEKIPENVKIAYHKSRFITPRITEHIIADFGNPTYAFYPKDTQKMQ